MVPGLLTDEYLFLLKRSVRNITNGKAFSIPWIIHEYTEQGTNSDFLLVSKLRLKTTPMFALEKRTRLERKQTHFILTLPVAGAVFIECVIHVVLTLYLKITDASIQDCLQLQIQLKISVRLT